MEFRDMQSKNCHALEFSDGGHLFAAALGNLVSVFSSDNFLLTNTFVGHVSHIKTLRWGQDNSNFLFSVGLDGNIFFWDLSKDSRVEDASNLHRSTTYTSIVVDICQNHSKRSRIVGSNDGYFVEQSWLGGEKGFYEVRQINSNMPSDNHITALCLNKSRTKLFAGLGDGRIRTYHWPLENTTTFQDFNIGHSNVAGFTVRGREPAFKGVVTMRCSDNLLFSTGSDGSVFIFELQRTLLSSKDDTVMSKPILVNAEQYAEQQEYITDLISKVEDLKSDTEFALHNKESLWQAELKELTENTHSLIKAEKQRFEELQTKHGQTIQRHARDLEENEQRHSNTIQQIEIKFKRNFSLEKNRCEEMEESMNARKTEFNEQLQKRTGEHERTVRSLEQNSEQKILSLSNKISSMKEESVVAEKNFREILDQQEEEYENEILYLHGSAKIQRKVERNNKGVLQGTIERIESKKSQSEKKIAEMKLRVQQCEQEQKREILRREKIEALVIDIQREKEETEKGAHRKDEIIESMKSENSRLGKVRYVLEHELQEQYDERKPLDTQIQNMDQQLKSKQNLLEEEQSRTAKFERIAQQRIVQKLSQEKENISLKKSLRKVEKEISSTKIKLAEILETGIDSKSLGNAVKLMYQQMIRSEDAPSNREEPAVEEICLNAKNGKDKHAKRINQVLRQQAVSESAKNMVIGENVTLINECNRLRKDNVLLKREIFVLSKSIKDFKSKLKTQYELDQRSQPTM